MTKKNRNILFGILILLVVFGILAQQGLLPFATTSLLVESVDMIDIISNEADLDNSFFRIVASVGRGAEEVVGQVSSSQFNRELTKPCISRDPRPPVLFMFE